MSLRVLRDIFHIIDMLKVSKTHAFSRLFHYAMSLAILVYHPGDLAAVRAVVERKGQKWEYVFRTKRSWLHERCRRFSGDGELTAARIKRVIDTYGDKLDPKTNKPLIDAERKRKAQNIIESARRGEVSDPPGVSFYTVKGKDKDGLTLYYCSRGTSGLEGGTHQTLSTRFVGPSTFALTYNAIPLRLRRRVCVSLFVPKSCTFVSPHKQKAYTSAQKYTCTHTTSCPRCTTENIHPHRGTF